MNIRTNSIKQKIKYLIGFYLYLQRNSHNNLKPTNSFSRRAKRDLSAINDLTQDLVAFLQPVANRERSTLIKDLAQEDPKETFWQSKISRKDLLAFLQPITNRERPTLIPSNKNLHLHHFQHRIVNEDQDNFITTEISHNFL